ncbi:MAG TPA: hypothetical protein PK119_00785 [Candidatus Paceibacterota bacterium]|nr:hypothetical protein [Candidatus Paceibacterota bacterium]
MVQIKLFGLIDAEAGYESFGSKGWNAGTGYYLRIPQVSPITFTLKSDWVKGLMTGTWEEYEKVREFILSQTGIDIYKNLGDLFEDIRRRVDAVNTSSMTDYLKSFLDSVNLKKIVKANFEGEIVSLKFIGTTENDLESFLKLCGWCHNELRAYRALKEGKNIVVKRRILGFFSPPPEGRIIDIIIS